MDYKYAVFDLDGTLLNSIKIWRQKEAILLESFTERKLSKETLAYFESLMFRKAIIEAEKICGKY